MKNKWFLRIAGGLSALILGALMAFGLAHTGISNGSLDLVYANDCAGITADLGMDRVSPANLSNEEVRCASDEWCCRHDFSKEGNPCIKCCKKTQ